MKINKNKKKKCILTTKFITVVLLIVVMLFSPIFSSVANAVKGEGEKNSALGEDDGVTYDSWIQEENIYDSVYQGTTEVAPSEDNLWMDVDEWMYESLGDTVFAPVGWAWELLTLFIVGVGAIVEICLDGGAGMFDQNFTLDAIIYGRILEDVNTNYVRFELVENNIYGIMGATFYRFFENFCFSIFVIMILVMLARQFFGGDEVSRKRAELKDTVTYTALMFLFLYLMPHITDLCLFVSDWMLTEIGELIGMRTSTSAYIVSANTGLSDVYAEMALDGNTLASALFALLYVATVFATFFFFIDYVVIAVKQTFLFGVFPFIAVFSIKNRRLLSNWCAEFFPNIFIPLIDGFLMMLPIVFSKIAINLDMDGYRGEEMSPALFIIVVVMIWNVIPVRKEALRLLGQSGVLGGQRGMGGIMAAAMMGMRMMTNAGMSLAGNAMGTGGFGLSDLSGKGLSSADAAQMNGELASLMRSGEPMLISNAASEGVDRIVDSASEMPVEDMGKGLADSAIVQDGQMEAADIVAGAGGEGVMPDDSYELKDLDFDDMRDENLAMRDDMMGEISQYEQDSMGIQSEIDELSGYNKYDASLLQRDADLGSELQRVDQGIEVLRNEYAGSDDMRHDMRYRELSTRREQLSVAINENNNELARSATRITESYGTTGGSAKDIVESGMVRRQQDINTKEAQLRGIQRDSHSARERIAEVGRREKEYAARDKMYGGSGTVYNSSADYQHAKRVENIRKKYIDVNNFDHRDFSPMVSPEERMRYYNERARMEQRDKTIRQVTRVAKVGTQVAGGIAGGVIGGTVSLYGGPQATMSGAMIGGMAASTLGGNAVQYVGDKKRVRNAESFTPSKAALERQQAEKLRKAASANKKSKPVQNHKQQDKVVSANNNSSIENAIQRQNAQASKSADSIRKLKDEG